MVERILEVTDDKYHYSSGYYTVNKWIDRENVVLARSEKQTIGASDNPRDDKTELVRCNVFTGEKEVLCNDVMAYQEYLVYKNLLYYVNGKQLIRINLDTNNGTSSGISHSKNVFTKLGFSLYKLETRERFVIKYLYDVSNSGKLNVAINSSSFDVITVFSNLSKYSSIN
jgi:hypothetical protein